MPIIGDWPEQGVRFDLERGGGPPWQYEGVAITPQARFRVSVTLSEAGDVRSVLAADAPPGLADKVRLVVKASWRHTRAEGARAPPRRIVRWRREL